MEIAIVAGLGVLGWRIAAKGTTPRQGQEVPHQLKDQNEFPFNNQLDTAIGLDADSQRIRDHVRRVYDPATGQYTFPTDVPDNGQWGPTQPFITSDKTFHNDAQRRVELYTGMEDTWRHKSEKAPVFNPAEKRVTVGSGGTTKAAGDLYDAQELKDRNVFGTKLNNVLPFEQKRVGPGLGVGANTPSADGLHSRFRVLPTEQINAHRVNELPGRAPSGAALAGFGKGDRRYDSFVQKGPSLVEHAPQVTSGRAVISGPTYQSDACMKPTRAQGTSREYHGTPWSTMGSGLEAKSRVHVQGAKYQLKPTPLVVQGTEQGLKAPTETVKVYERYTGKRDQKTPGVTGVGGVTAYAPKADGCFIMKNTFRESSIGSGPATSVVNTGSARVCGPSTSGFRESRARAAGEYSFLKESGSKQCFSMGDGRETKGRYMHGRLDGGVWQKCTGRVQRKIMKNAYGNAPAGNVPTALQRADYYGKRESKKKISSCDPRTETLGLGLFGGGCNGT